MRPWLCCLPLVAVGLSAPAVAQSTFMPSVIGNTVGGMNQVAPNKCFDGRMAPKPTDVAKGIARADALIQRYREMTASGPDVKKIFINSTARWRLDGAPQHVRNLHDPWIANVASLERVALTVGNWGHYYHVQWRAYSADGSPIGLYDALLNSTGTQFTWLDLYSPSATALAAPNTPFCNEPGDIEKWKEAKAKREAEKAAKRVAKESEQSARATN